MKAELTISSFVSHIFRYLTEEEEKKFKLNSKKYLTEMFVVVTVFRVGYKKLVLFMPLVLVLTSVLIFLGIPEDDDDALSVEFDCLVKISTLFELIMLALVLKLPRFSFKSNLNSLSLL